jgi:hypothetical protein
MGGEPVSVKNVETSFRFQAGTERAHEFTGICELGFSTHGSFVVHAWTTPPGSPRGSYFTSVPISPLSYRRKYRTCAAFDRLGGELVVYCDYGKPYTVAASLDVIDALERECVANEIPHVSAAA